MKGIILAGGLGTRLSPLTQVISKQLLPVYDKPMIHYPLSTLLLAGVTEILVISDRKSLPSYQDLLKDGSQIGITIAYAVQDEPNGLPQAFIIAEDFTQGESCALILGDNVFHGVGLGTSLRELSLKKTGATIFAYEVSNPGDYGVIELSNGAVKSLEEKPEFPKSNLAIPGLYFLDNQAQVYARQIKYSARGELEILDLLKEYNKRDSLDVCVLPRGTVWLDTGTPEGILEAANYIKIVEDRQGLKISCIEEVALNLGLITTNQMELIISNYPKSSYREYLIKALMEAN
jgi:glucose-1-phosphate thymidylyltransferase